MRASRLLFLICFVGMILGTPGFLSKARADFSDLSENHEYYAAVTSLMEQRIVQGYSDGSFKPDQEVTRAEALKIILMGTDLSVDEGSAAGVLFSDIEEGDWFFSYVSTAVSLGIIQGYEDGTFKPQQSVNRAEAMKMLLIASEVSLPEVSDPPFPDVALTEWYVSYANYAKLWNLDPPQTDGLWHAEEVISRGNMAEMLYRLTESEAQGHSFDASQNWPVKDFPTVDIQMKVPFDWGYKQEGVGAVFLLDRDHGQVSLLTPYENGGTLLLTRYANPDGKSMKDLFEEISANSAWETEEVEVNDYETLKVYHEEGVYYREWYLGLDNGSLVHVVALRGDGAYSKYLEWFFDAMVASITYSSAGTSDLTIEETVEALREAIQVDGVGAQMMELLSDWELIETDTIGVGTGPVDYYYSPSANITIKYERSFDVLLNLKEGETTAF